MINIIKFKSDSDIDTAMQRQIWGIGENGEKVNFGRYSIRKDTADLFLHDIFEGADLYDGNEIKYLYFPEDYVISPNAIEQLARGLV